MAKLFGIGTKVKFLTTSDSGIIVEKLGDGMVMVKLDGFDMEIPAFEEDLLRAEDFLSPQIEVPAVHPKHAEKKANSLKKNADMPPLSINRFYGHIKLRLVIDDIESQFAYFFKINSFQNPIFRPFYAVKKDKIKGENNIGRRIIEQ